MHRELGEKSLCLVIGHGRMNNYIVPLLPVHGSRDAVLVTQLKRVNDTDNLVLNFTIYFMRILTGKCIEASLLLTKLRPVEAG